MIDLRLPQLSPTGDDDTALLNALLAMEPKLAIFAFTFIIVGMSWLGHHRKFSYIARIDSRLMWMNLLYLMALCLVPFASSVLSEHGGRMAFVLYAVVMTLVVLLSSGLSAYGLRQPFLADPNLQPDLRRDMVFSPLLSGITFVITAAMALGNWLRAAHWALFMIVPVMMFFGTKGHRAR